MKASGPHGRVTTHFVGRVRGRRPLMCTCVAMPEVGVSEEDFSSSENKVVTAVRLAPRMLHFFGREGNLMDLWRFRSELVCMSCGTVVIGGEARTVVVVATEEGEVWVLPVPDRTYYTLPTKSARVNAEASADDEKAAPLRKSSNKGKSKKADEAPRKRARTDGSFVQNLTDRNSSEAFFTSRRSPHMAIDINQVTHAPYLLVTLPGVDYVAATPYGILTSNPVVGVALYSTGSVLNMLNTEAAGLKESDAWGRQIHTFPRLRRLRTTCTAVVVSTETENVVEGQGLQINRNLYAALFGHDMSVLIQPILVHGDEDGTVSFTAFFVATPSILRPCILFELKESIENLSASGCDMFLVSGQRGQVLVSLTNENADLETRAFHVSMPITRSFVTEKCMVFLSGRRLYTSSLGAEDEGETSFEHEQESFDDDDQASKTDKCEPRRMPFSLFPRAFPLEGTISTIHALRLRKPSPKVSRPSSRTPINYRVTALSFSGKLIQFDLPSLRILDLQMQDMISLDSKLGGPRIQSLLENISTLSVEQQACEAREEKVDQEIAALSHAIYVLSEHVCWQSKTSTETVTSDVLPFLPDDANGIGCDVKLSVEPNTLVTSSSIHTVMATIELANHTRFDLVSSRWSFILRVSTRREGYEIETYSQTFPLGEIKKGSIWSLRAPLPLSTMGHVSIEGILCAQFLCGPSDGRSVGEYVGHGVAKLLFQKTYDVLDILCPRSFGTKSRRSKHKASETEAQPLIMQKTSLSIVLQPPPSVNSETGQDTTLGELIPTLLDRGGDSTDHNDTKKGSGTRVSLTSCLGDMISLRAKQATLTLKKGAINETSPLPAYVITVNCVSWLAPLLRSALLSRVLSLQALCSQTNASPDRLKASVWARTYRDISLKKSQLLHQALQSDVVSQIQQALDRLAALRDGQPLGLRHLPMDRSIATLQELVSLTRSIYYALRQHTNASLLF